MTNSTIDIVSQKSWQPRIIFHGVEALRQLRQNGHGKFRVVSVMSMNLFPCGHLKHLGRLEGAGMDERGGGELLDPAYRVSDRRG